MKNILFLFWAHFAFSNLGLAQNLAPAVLGAAGTVVEGGGITLGFTVGELAVENRSATSIRLCEGFWQPISKTSKTEGAKNFIFPISLSPNPFRADLTLHFPEEFAERVKIQVHDFLGTQVFETETWASRQVKLQPPPVLSEGMYLISIRDDLGRLVAVAKALKL